jgi:predicted DsbA family dithiol-disulfide isomerase
MHDLLFQNQRRLTKTDLASHAEIVGLDGKRFGECLAGEMKAQVRRDAESAARLGIRGTPAFLIGALEPGLRVRVTRTLAGASSPEVFITELDAALRRGTASGFYGVAVLVGIVATGAVAVGVRRRRRSGNSIGG